MLIELLRSKKGGLSPRWVQLFNSGKRLDVLQQLIDSTDYLPEETPVKVRYYHLVHGPEVPKCICGAPAAFHGAAYVEFCSKKCADADPNRINKINKTKEERYGTNYKEVLLDQIKKTNLERYGVEFPLQNKDIKAKTSGFTNESRIKAKERLVERFGVASGNANLSSEIKTQLDANANRLHYEEQWTITAIAKHYGVSNIAVISRLSGDVKRFGRSALEIKALRYVLSLDSNLEVVTNDRTQLKPKEIDLWIPSKGIGIELHGNYYHSDLRQVDRNLHIDKAILAESKGIRLIQLFESDMESDKWKGIVRTALGYNKKLPARRTEVKHITKQEAQSFLTEHHFQGAGISPTIAYGLYSNDVLVQVMTFGPSRYNKSCEWELLRNASRVGLTVVGGSSKLFTAFIKQYNPSSVISYCDRRLFTGNGYKQMGFSLSHHSNPSYHYFHTKDQTLRMYHRSHFQKHKLPSLLETFDPDLTEWENMVANGWNRIFDCGNSVWIWKNEKGA